MPTSPDFSKCAFYRLICRDVNVKECYVGHTCGVVNRRHNHKIHCNNEKDILYNTYVYRFIREHGGWDNWQLLVHEKLAVKDHAEAALRERFWLEHYGATLNTYLPAQSQAEYYAKNRDQLIKNATAWQLANSDRLKSKHECACGGRYTTACYSKHIKSKRHIAAETAH
jgi:hypothetical protein